MNTINILPVFVALNTTANKVVFQVLTLDLSPTEFKLNARFFQDTNEITNIPFELPLSVYELWTDDKYLEDVCLSHFKLERANNG
jgi:hypothetical protein